jgi:prepilin-type N-terminal cleavage/methylation domain-containing protein
VRAQLRSQKGFTLIELLIVIIIIGVLAGISVSIWNKRKAEAIIASMKSDLRNLAVSEEAYFSDYSAYASDTGDLVFRSSPNVVFTLQADQDGWAANASHPAVSTECGLYFGDIAALSPARREGIVWCE